MQLLQFHPWGIIRSIIWQLLCCYFLSNQLYRHFYAMLIFFVHSDWKLHNQRMPTTLFPPSPWLLIVDYSCMLWITWESSYLYAISIQSKLQSINSWPFEKTPKLSLACTSTYNISLSSSKFNSKIQVDQLCRLFLKQIIYVV